MATIYRKTAKGQAEIESRTLKLAPRFRTVLIMVDGRRTDEEILRQTPAGAGDALAALLSAGLVEPSKMMRLEFSSRTQMATNI